MAPPELIIDGEDQYKRLADRINVLRSAATAAGKPFTVEDKKFIAQYQESTESETGVRPSFDQAAEKLASDGFLEGSPTQPAQRRAKSATAKEIELWVNEIVRQVQTGLVAGGTSPIAATDLWQRIRNDVAFSLLRDREDDRFNQVVLAQEPLWVQIARTLAYEESDSARFVSGSLLYRDRRREISAGLAKQGVITEQQRMAINGEPGSDSALSEFAVQFNEEFKFLVPKFMALVREEQRSRGGTSKTPTTGILATLTQTVIKGISIEDIEAGFLPLPESVRLEYLEGLKEPKEPMAGLDRLIQAATQNAKGVITPDAFNRLVDQALGIQKVDLARSKYPEGDEGQPQYDAVVLARSRLLADVKAFDLQNPGQPDALVDFIITRIGINAIYFQREVDQARTDLDKVVKAKQEADAIAARDSTAEQNEIVNQALRKAGLNSDTVTPERLKQLRELAADFPAEQIFEHVKDNRDAFAQERVDADKKAADDAQLKREFENAPAILEDLIRAASTDDRVLTLDKFTDKRLARLAAYISTEGTDFVRSILRGPLVEEYLLEKKEFDAAEAAKKAADVDPRKVAKKAYERLTGEPASNLTDNLLLTFGQFIIDGGPGYEPTKGTAEFFKDLSDAEREAEAAKKTAEERAAILGDESLTEEETRNQLHNLGFDSEDLLPEHFEELVEFVRNGGILDDTDRPVLDRGVALKRQYDINVEAVSKEGITRTLRDLGVLKLGVDDEFTRRVEGTTIPQIEQILAEKQSFDPTAPLDTQAIATRLLGLKIGEPAQPMMQMPARAGGGPDVVQPFEPGPDVPRFTDPVGQQFFREQAMMPDPRIDYKSREQLIREAEQIDEADTPGLSAGVTAALVASGRQPLPTLGRVGTITEEERLRLQFPDDSERARFAAEASGEDPFFQQFILGEMGKPGFRTAFSRSAADKQRARETEAFKRFAFRAGPKGELPPAPWRRELTPAELVKLSPEQLKRIVKRKEQRKDIPQNIKNFMFRRESAVQPTSSLDFARTQLPRFKEAFELEPATIDRRQREQEQQGALDTQRSLRKGRTIFRFGT